MRERYINNIYMVDRGLKYFFEELEKRDYLKNVLVIVTGDHSFPIGEHGIEHNEAGFYDEFFRIPLFIYQKNQIKSQLIERAYSQIDIAPTIVDYLHLSVKKNHFEGCSIFNKLCKKPVLILQPYNGIFLGSIRYPLKYSIRLQTGKESVFNLQKDSMEQYNIINNINKYKLKTLRKDINLFYLNQTVLQKDDFL
jgi:arylsulfatase A-like enzyme